MADQEGYKEVYFHQYCKTCKYAECKNTDDPCNECLDDYSNLYSHKPVKYVKKDEKK